MTFSARRWASPALVAAGAALIAAAVATGGASFFLVLVVPVFTGSSALFLLGALLLVLGLFALPLTLGPYDEVGSARPSAERTGVRPSAPSAHPPEEAFPSGGVVLVGPVPVFFGGWKNAPRWAYVLAASVGAGLLLLGALLVVLR